MQSVVISTCRGCGCTDLRACEGGCEWTLLDIDTATGVCSRCAEEVGWDMRALLMLGGAEEEP